MSIEKPLTELEKKTEAWWKSPERDQAKNRLTAIALAYCKDQFSMQMFLDEYANEFLDSPASSKFHGASPGGLVKHVTLVEKLFKEFLLNHPEIIPKDMDINRLAAICGWLHDLCKVGVYKPKVLKSGRDAADPYEFNESFPLGHGEKSVALLLPYFNLSAYEQMIIRWHMGPFDYSWKGAEDSIKKKFPLVINFFCADWQASNMEEGKD